jgi:hypothetical protein
VRQDSKSIPLARLPSPPYPTDAATYTLPVSSTSGPVAADEDNEDKDERMSKKKTGETFKETPS